MKPALINVFTIMNQRIDPDKPLRVNLSLSIAPEAREYILNTKEQLAALHPPGKSYKPKAGQAVETLVEHAKTTGFRVKKSKTLNK